MVKPLKKHNRINTLNVRRYPKWTEKYSIQLVDRFQYIYVNNLNIQSEPGDCLLL